MYLEGGGNERKMERGRKLKPESIAFREMNAKCKNYVRGALIVVPISFLYRDARVSELAYHIELLVTMTKKGVNLEPDFGTKFEMATFPHFEKMFPILLQVTWKWYFVKIKFFVTKICVLMSGI